MKNLIRRTVKMIDTIVVVALFTIVLGELAGAADASLQESPKTYTQYLADKGSN